MKLLLDTHVALWAISEPERLPPPIREAVADPANDVFVSVVSLWEIAIKHGLGRGSTGMPVSAARALERFDEVGFSVLTMTAQHAVTVEALPAHHTDPFDRLIVAQALSEPMRLLTHDVALARYSDTVILF
ncbi:MAG TPA: type II toxin-antitoxin system VapC family toxin [Caulobacteraceae bacterium]|nr:type II toxin-antitoxin system VapC family toxin [Caulobacteraceae bacterium]